MAGGDAEVAGERDLEGDAEAVAVDHADRWEWRGPDATDAISDLLDERACRRWRQVLERVEVHPRRECPLPSPRQDDRPRHRLLLRHRPRDRLQVVWQQGVQLLRARQGD